MLTDEIIIGTAEFFSDHKGVEQKDIVEFARAIESAACAPLLERIAELEAKNRLLFESDRRNEAQLVRIAACVGRDAAGAPEHDRTIAGAAIDEITRLRAKLAQQSEPLAEVNNYIQSVPNHCDRIVWRGQYYHLPLPLSQAKPGQAATEQQEPTDSMGLPVSCGKPLCSPGDHHPLCAQAPNAQQAEPSCASKTVDSETQAALSARGSQQEQAEAQPVMVQEPVLCVAASDLENLLRHPSADKSIKAWLPPAFKSSEVPLYTAQPKAVPLTKQMQRLSMEELEAIFQCGGDVYTNVQSALAAKNGIELADASEKKGG